MRHSVAHLRSDRALPLCGKQIHRDPDQLCSLRGEKAIELLQLQATLPRSAHRWHLIPFSSRGAASPVPERAKSLSG